MMYEAVKKILDVSKEKDLDILVARDTLIAEDRERSEEYSEACEVIKTYYKFITGNRNEGNEEAIKELCDLYEAGKKAEIREKLKEYEVE